MINFNLYYNQKERTHESDGPVFSLSQTRPQATCCHKISDLDRQANCSSLAPSEGDTIP